MAHHKPGKVLFHGIEAGMKLFRWLVLVLVVLFWLSGISSIPDKNVGLLTRFGRILPKSEQTRERGAGFVLAFPYPIDELVQVPTGVEQRIEVSEVWASLDLPIGERKIDPITEGYCLTGDQNIVQTRFVVKYYIRNAEQFHFHVDDPNRIIQDVLLASLTETITTWSIDDVLLLSQGGDGAADSRVDLRAVVMDKAQERLDQIQCGVMLTGVEFVDMHYPRHVKNAFENVQTTRTAAATLQKQREKDATRERTTAQTQRTRLIDYASESKIQIVSEAQSESDQFRPMYEEYRRSPHLVWQRMYAETMEAVWSNVGRLDLVPANSRVILPTEQEGAQP